MANYSRYLYEDYYREPRESGMVDQETRVIIDTNVAHDYVWHGRSLETPEEATEWLDTLADENTRDEFKKVVVSRALAVTILKRFGQMDADSETSPSTQLGMFLNTMRQQGTLKNLTQTLLKIATQELGVGNSELYRLFYHADIEMEAEDPDVSRSAHNLLSMIDNANVPPDTESVLAHLQTPIKIEDTRPLQAVANLTGSLAQENKLRSDVALRNALAGTYNLLRFIHEQRPDHDQPSNAGQILQTLKSHHAQDAYAGLRDRTGQVPHIPYTAYIQLANRFSKAIAELEGTAGKPAEIARLDQTSIAELPKAIDRIIFIACLGNVAAPIAQNLDVQAAISTSRLAIDNVLHFGVERKVGAAQLTLQDVIIALRTYLPPDEAAAAIQRMTEDEENIPSNRDALQRRIRVGRQLWMEHQVRKPGYGKLS